jgi:O-antigen/teichoic acid export membrane protein
MIFASGLGLIKGMILAKILTQVDFGQYVSISGVSMLSSSLLSFGLIEETTKRYPLLWVMGKYSEILNDAKYIIKKIALMFFAAMLLLAVLNFFVFKKYAVLDVLLVGLLGFSTSLLTIVASIFRASESLQPFQVFSLNRNMIALFLSIIGGMMFSWKGSIVGDILAAVFVIIISLKSINNIFAQAKQVSIGENIEQPQKIEHTEKLDRVGGRMLYLANLLTSSTVSLDRALINTALGAASAGTYGILSLITQVVQLLVNIIGQGIGPLMIKSEFSGKTDGSIMIKPLVQIIFCCIVSGLLALFTLILKWRDFPSGFFQKYDISNISIMLAACIGTMSMFRLLEFKLLSYHKEQKILIASVVSTAIFFSLFYIGWLLSLSLDWYLLFVLLSRTVQISILTLFIRQHSHLNKLLKPG